jgi:hypothetical protein
MRLTTTITALLLAPTPAAAEDGGWRDLPEESARRWIVENARQQAQEFCLKYPDDAYCRPGRREGQKQGGHSSPPRTAGSYGDARNGPPVHTVTRKLDFCGSYGLHRQDYVRDGWQYWRCVK